MAGVPGNSFNTALDLGVLTNNQSFNSLLGGSGNSYDYYKFQLTSNSTLNLDLTGLTSSAGITLFNSTESYIANTNGDAQAEVSKNLAPGTYYIEVSPSSNTSTPYTLQASATALAPIPADNAGHTQATALDLGTLGGAAQTLSGFVGNYYGLTQNTDDYYKLQVTANSTLNLNFSGASANLSLFLLNSNGGVATYSSGDAQVTISQNVAPGTYYLDVRGSTLEVATPYTLQATATALAPIPTDNAGHTQATALDLGALGSTPQTLNGFVGNYYGLAQNSYDYYKFQVTDNSALRAHF